MRDKGPHRRPAGLAGPAPTGAPEPQVARPAAAQPAAPPRVAVVVPVKSFDLAKGRLARHLDPEHRGRLSRQLAAGVLAAAGDLERWVACDNDEVARWAASQGAAVMRHPEPGLNPAVAHAVAELGRLGVDRVIVAHGDLPLAHDITWVGQFDGVTIVPDRRSDGTNVLCVPTGTGFAFAYGPGSAQRHRAEAERRGLPLRVVADEDLGWDIDTPDDLALFDSLGRSAPGAGRPAPGGGQP